MRLPGQILTQLTGVPLTLELIIWKLFFLERIVTEVEYYDVLQIYQIVQIRNDTKEVTCFRKMMHVHVQELCCLPILQRCVIDCYNAITFLCSNLGLGTGYPEEVFFGFLQCLHADVRMTPVLGHGSFVPNPFQFTDVQSRSVVLRFFFFFLDAPWSQCET